MSYVSGSIFDFAFRLHFYSSGTGDLANYKSETGSYANSGIISGFLQEKWQRELNKRNYVFTKSGSIDG